MSSLNAVVGRGGLLHPIPGGIYRINEGMKADLLAAKYGEHASNLGALIADAFAKQFGIPPLLRILWLWMSSRMLRESRGTSSLSELAFSCAKPKGSGASICKRARCLLRRSYANYGSSWGRYFYWLAQTRQSYRCQSSSERRRPFSPERSGTLPAGDLARLCFSGQYTIQEVLK